MPSRLTRSAFAAVPTFLAAASISLAATPPAPPAGARTSVPALSIADLLSAPFPTELSAAQAGGALAWIEYERGARSVWVALPPEYRAERRANFEGDDGVELRSLVVSPDGATLAFVRGGDEGFGNAARTNTASEPAGGEESVWVVASKGTGTARKIGAGKDPEFSTDGKRVAFLRAGEIWWAPVAEKDEAGKKTEAEALVHARGCSSIAFAPAGDRMAFVSSRDDHAFVGVLDLAAKIVRWMDPSVDTDSDPSWSPDGSSIAFLRFATSSEPPNFSPHKQAEEPWSIRVADPATGKGRQLFRADHGPGSVIPDYLPSRAPIWAAGGEILFAWEKTGWTHYYAIPAAGGAPRELGSGAWEVATASLSRDGKRLLVAANRDDVDGQRAFSIDVATGALRRVAETPGAFEFNPIETSDGGAVAFLASDARQPVTPTIVPRGGKPRPLRPDALPAAFPLRSLVVPQPVVFAAADGKPVHGQLFFPPNARVGEKHPGVIFVHGGPIRQMFCGWHWFIPYTQAYAVNQALASRGTVVLSVNYRAGIGYGLDFREAEGIGEDGASEFQDVVGGATFLRARPEVDPARIGIWGGSYGGYLTAMALARTSSLFRAGVDFCGVHDWNLEFPNPPFDRRWQASTARMLASFLASPLAEVAHWRSPVLLIQGDDDHNVPFAETVQLVEQLRKVGAPFEQLIYPDETHGFHVHRHTVESFEATIDFFDRKLGALPSGR